MDIARWLRSLTRPWRRLGAARQPEVRIVLAVTLCLFLVLAVTAPALAGPGGQFAKALFKTWPGKIVLGVLCFILLPLALYVWIREVIEVRKTRRDLAQLAETREYFDWARIEARVEVAAAAVGHAWGTGDLEAVADTMTEEYHQNQQALLDRWRMEGKRNVYEFHDVNKIKPLYVHSGGWWQDQVSVLISATVVDYLEDVETGKVLKGKKRKDRDYETIWNLVRENGAWCLDSIQEGSDSLVVAMRANRIEPATQRQPAWPLPSELSSAQVLEDFFAPQEEQATVEVAGGDDGERQPGEDAQGRQQQG